MNGWSTQPRLGANRTRPSALTDGAGNRDSYAETAHARLGRQQLVDHLGRGVDDVLDVVLARRMQPLAPLQHVPAERHQRRDDAVDADVDRRPRRCPAAAPAPATAARTARTPDGCRSLTRPSSSSVVARPPIVLRFRPRSRVSAARLMAPWTWTRVRSALRLFRRSSSCPRPVFVGDAGGLPDRGDMTLAPARLYRMQWPACG